MACFCETAMAWMCSWAILHLHTESLEVRKIYMCTIYSMYVCMYLCNAYEEGLFPYLHFVVLWILHNVGMYIRTCVNFHLMLQCHVNCTKEVTTLYRVTQAIAPKHGDLCSRVQSLCAAQFVWIAIDVSCLFLQCAMSANMPQCSWSTYDLYAGVFDWYFFMGPGPESVVQQYQEVIGRPYLPP